MRPNPLIGLCLAALGLAALSTVDARSTDIEQPLHIEADQVELNERNGVSTYTGHVFMKQGSLEVRAQRIKVYAPGKALDRIVAEGTPATLEQLTDEGKHVRADAEKMEYYASQRLINLLGKASLQQEGNEFSAERIVYHIVKGRVNAGATDGTGRVKVIIQPELLEQKMPADAPSTVAPSTVAPSTVAPSTDAPSTDAPSTDAPSTDAPSTDAPSTDAPSTDAPSTDAPSTVAPSTDTPQAPSQ